MTPYEKIMLALRFEELEIASAAIQAPDHEERYKDLAGGVLLGYPLKSIEEKMTARYLESE